MFRRVVLPLSLAVLAVAGCGGHDAASSTRSATAGERAVAAKTFTSLASALHNSRWALQFNPLADVSTGLAPTLPPNVGDPLGGVPEDEIPSFYRNDPVGAWEQVSGSGDTYREDYYLDEGKSQPAGFYTSLPAAGANGATSWTDHYEFGAGAFAGAQGDSTSTSFDGDESTSDDDLWTCSYNATAPDGTVFKGVFSYKGLSLTSAGTTSYGDGTKDTFSAQFDVDDAGKLRFASRDGVTLEADFKDGGRASGTLTGSAEGLPATFRIDDGGVKIRFHGGGTVIFTNDAEPMSKAIRDERLLAHRAHLSRKKG